MTLGCRSFFYEFIGLVNHENKDGRLAKIYHKWTEWTTLMLGNRQSRDNDDYGLIGRVGQKYHYETEPEWRDIDQVWSVLLPKPLILLESPWKLDVLVEHENDIKRLEYTLFKFLEIDAPLKIGIFYPADYEEDSLEKCREIIKNQVPLIPSNQYLIIFGFLNETSNQIIWHGYEIDFRGNIVKLHEL